MNSRFNNILEPISQDLPCGEDLSFSPEFDRIQEARREDDPTVDYGEWQAALKQADWNAVVECCTDLLQKRSKDLRLSAWLTEGLVKTEGLRGLADGIEITARLLERFGEHIHPQAEAGDQEQRIGNLSWFVTRIAQLTRQIPVTAAKTGQFSVNDYEAACTLQTQLQRNADAITDLESKVTLEKISAAIAKTDKGLYTAWLAETERCETALAELTRAADARFGIDGPSFSSLASSIDAVRQRLQSIANELGILAPAAMTAAANPGRQELAPELVMPATTGPIKSRAQALELLRQVAAFFRNTEPHSPVAYLAEKAVHWGSMPLHAWLRSVVKDQGSLSHIEELLGMEMEEGGRS